MTSGWGFGLAFASNAPQTPPRARILALAISRLCNIALHGQVLCGANHRVALMAARVAFPRPCTAIRDDHLAFRIN